MLNSLGKERFVAMIRSNNSEHCVGWNTFFARKQYASNNFEFFLFDWECVIGIEIDMTWQL